MTHEKVGELDQNNEGHVQPKRQVKVIDIANKSLSEIYLEIDPSGKLWQDMKLYQDAYDNDARLTHRCFLACIAFIFVCLFVVLFFRP
jgi:hypothetical protein